MKRSALVRKSPMVAHKAARKAGETKLRTSMRRSRAKMTPIRKSAKDEDCTIVLRGVCNHDTTKVVLCHENSAEAGKGMALKARDTEAAYGCNACHDVYDRRVPLPAWLTREQVDASFMAGKARTQEKLRKKGLA